MVKKWWLIFASVTQCKVHAVFLLSSTHLLAWICIFTQCNIVRVTFRVWTTAKSWIFHEVFGLLVGCLCELWMLTFYDKSKTKQKLKLNLLLKLKYHSLSHYTAAIRTLFSASDARLLAMAIWFSISCICTVRHHNNCDLGQTNITDKTHLSNNRLNNSSFRTSD